MTNEIFKLDNSVFDQSVGEVVTFVGLKGTMKVRPSSNNPVLFLDIQNVLLKSMSKNAKDKKKVEKDKNEPDEITKATVKDIKLVKNFLQIQLNEYDSRSAVENFRGAQLFTIKSELRNLKENEWWVKDLIGLEVYTTEGKLIGTICDAPGEHGEFLEIKKTDNSQGETTIVSFVKELFPVVDLKLRRIEVIDLPGLFE